MGATAVELEIVCPAGEPVHETTGGAACRCRILRQTIREREDPTSIRAFCAASPTSPTSNDSGEPTAYTDCPVWQKQRDAEAAGTHRDLERELTDGLSADQL